MTFNLHKLTQMDREKNSKSDRKKERIKTFK